jgi:beta-galactosidase
MGFLEDRIEADDAHKRRYARQGDPDFQAFHHDLYRAVGNGRWWIMEQQPGPVNWAPYNPAPLLGMPRLWAWEAFAHGAEAVCYFRWRQAPFAQEQMHAGMLRPDSQPAQAFHEAAQVVRELAEIPEVEAGQAPVALIFDYAAQWAWQVQPQGQGQDYFRLVFETYRALRKLGQSVDILPPDSADLSGYRLVLAPGAVTLTDAFKAALAAHDAPVILGPRTNAKTADMHIPVPLPPAIPGLDVTVSRVESLRPDMPRPVEGGGHVQLWQEELEGNAEVTLRGVDGQPLAMTDGRITYLGAWLDAEAMSTFLRDALKQAGVETTDMPGGLRRRQAGKTEFLINYDPEPQTWDGVTVPAAGVAWR